MWEGKVVSMVTEMVAETDWKHKVTPVRVDLINEDEYERFKYLVFKWDDEMGLFLCN